MNETSGAHSAPNPQGISGPTPVRVLSCNGCSLVFEELAESPRDPLNGCPRCSRQDLRVIARTEH